MTIFEKTMQACLQDGATSKKLAEKKNVKKTSKKTITERKSIRRKFEADEPGFDDDEFGDDFGGGDFTDADTDDEGYADDVEDDASIKLDYDNDTVAVVDTDAEADNDSFLPAALAALQNVNGDNIEVAEDAIEDTVDGEKATTDNYVGQNVYVCPICGSAFFNEGEIGEKDFCPVCGETPEAFVACGVVEANDSDEDEGEEKEEAKEADDKTEGEAEGDDFDFGDEDDDDEDGDDEDDKKEEAYRRRVAMRRKAEARRRMEARRRNTRKSTKNESFLGWTTAIAKAIEKECKKCGITTEEEVDDLFAKYVKKYGNDGSKIIEFINANAKKTDKKDTKKGAKKEESRRRAPEYMLNEKTFERHLCRFFAENYSNVDDVTITTAIMKEGKLGVGAVLTFKSGKKKKVPFVVEGFNMKSGVYSVKDSKNAFEAKSSKRPFKFKVKVERNIVSCEGIAYKFETKSEGKRVLVSGTTLTESKKKISKPVSRKAEARASANSEDLEGYLDSQLGYSGNLQNDKLAKIRYLADLYAYDPEFDGSKKDARAAGKLVLRNDVNGGFSLPVIARQVKEQRPDIYDAIMNCKDAKELNAVTKRFEDAAYD